MSNEDKQGVLHELDAWCRRERVGRLTWARLEERLASRDKRYRAI